MEYRPQQIILNARTCFETICRLYYLRHGFEMFDPHMMSFLIHLANMSIECLRRNPPADAVEPLRATAMLCVKGINDQAASYCAAEAAFVIMEKRLHREDTDRVRTILTPKKSIKNERPIEDLVNSKWPIPIIYADADPRTSYLETLLKSTVALSLAESKAVSNIGPLITSPSGPSNTSPPGPSNT